MSNKFLLQNVSTDTIGTGVEGNGAGVSIVVWGASFGGGEVTLEISDDGGANYVPLTENGGNLLSFTENSSRFIIRVFRGQLIRASLSSSTAADDVNVKMTD